MTFEERAEAAAKVLPCTPFGLIEDTLRAAFPDLYGEKPTVWIAPWEASVPMSGAGKRAMEADDMDPTCTEVAVGFAAMRDAYLKRT